MNTSEDSNTKRPSRYIKKHGDIELETTDPIYDEMSEDEIDEANQRFSSLLEDDPKN